MLTIGMMKIYCFKCHKSCLVRLHTNPTTWMKNEKATETSPLPVLLYSIVDAWLLCFYVAVSLVDSFLILARVYALIKHSIKQINQVIWFKWLMSFG